MSAPEPYTVTEVVRGNGPIHDGTYYFYVYYRNYTRTQCFPLMAKDELEAFTLATQRLIKTKNHYDKYGKNKKEQTDEQPAKSV